ncbi:hypothetical protein PAPYR_9180 [Paratrimastix pyriformis]|uniref:Uncharacterized protein n=2 Tax=Paratrimastix pyriformis TaxID=342808 RepID=A0ABQ8U918_9EUKA|nr:hypothetical protein PAPYR_9180 [Paratrimastix pyriformis]
MDLFDQLPQELLPLFVENSGPYDAFPTYLHLIGTCRLIRERLRRALRSISIFDPRNNAEPERELERDLKWAPDFSLPAETVALLLGPCKSLQEITLGLAITRSGREETTYSLWIDAAFSQHPTVGSLRLTKEFCQSLTPGARPHLFAHDDKPSPPAPSGYTPPLFDSLARHCPELQNLAYENDSMFSNPCALQACRALRSLSLQYRDYSREDEMDDLGGWTAPSLPSDPQMEEVLSQLPELESLYTPDLGVAQAHPNLVTRLDVTSWLQRRSHGRDAPSLVYPHLTQLRIQRFGPGCLPLLVAVAPHLRVFRVRLRSHIDVGQLLAALQSAPHLSEVFLRNYPAATFWGLPALCTLFEFGIFAFSIGQLTMSSETHSVEDAGAVPLTLESVEAEANRQRMEAAGKKRVAEKSQAEEQGEKKEKVMVCVNWIVAFLPKVRLSRMFVGLILGLCLSIAFCELQAETMRFAIKFEPSAVQFSWYELECQLREILGEARVQQGLEEGTLA